MTDLNWLPAATRDDHGQRLTWTETTNPKGVLHTTEGTGWPDYRGWSVDPHATIMPHPGKGVEIRQHIPFSHASFALVHNAPQQTNRDYAFQFELIGTSEPGGPGYYWPDADDTVLIDLYHKVVEPLIVGRSLPATTNIHWKAYPGSYGTNNGVRLNAHQWDVYTGWCGHEHVVENLHGDPGMFPWARMIQLVTKQPTPTPPPTILETDMLFVRCTTDGTDAAAHKIGKGYVFQVSMNTRTHILGGTELPPGVPSAWPLIQSALSPKVIELPASTIAAQWPVLLS